MHWRCLVGHAWKEEDRCLEELFERGASKPHLTRTHFLFRCQRCDALKTKTLEGQWGRRRDDDDDDDNDDPPPAPRLTPDEFYERICKE